MRASRIFASLFAAAALLTPLAPAGAEVSLTVYSSADPAGFDPQQFIAQQRMGYNPQFAWQVPGFGVVKDVRELKFKDGVNDVQFTDVAAFIDPTTVSFADLDQPQATAVMEQQFLFDLVSAEKLVEKYVDKEITVRVALGDGGAELVRGRLLSVDPSYLILQTDQGVRMIMRSYQAQVLLGELPGGLITRPTLRWLVNSTAGGTRKVRTTYQTSGITWKADYNLLLNGDDTKADLAAWVTMINLSGASYKDAELKLIAGDVQRIQAREDSRVFMAGAMRKAAAAPVDAFEEKSFYEYHMYTLPRRTTVAMNTTQQIALFPTINSVPVEKTLVYEGAPQARHWSFDAVQQDRSFGDTSGKKVDVYLRLENTKENRMGLPLPRGKVRVYKQDQKADGSTGAPEFVGEDLIDHTAKNETIYIRTGQSFDVTGSRVQTDFTIDTRARVMTESFRITLANAKDAAQKVVIKEPLYRWHNWTITASTEPHKKIDARTIHFEVTVPPGGKKTVEYTVRYTW